MFKQIGLLSGAIITTAPCMADNLSLETTQFWYSGNFNLQSIADDFEGGKYRQKGTKSFAHSQFLARYENTLINTNLFVRFDADYKYTKDTAQLIRSVENDIPIDEKKYNIYLEGQQQVSKGVRLDKSIKVMDDLNLSLGVSYFEASNLIHGNIGGDLNYGNGNLNSANGLLDYSYNDDLIFDREVPISKGHGVSVDVGIFWEPTKKTRVSFYIDDLWSQTNWNAIDSTEAIFGFDRISIDDEGILTVRPALNGRHYNANLKTSFTKRTKLEATYSISDKWKVQQDIFLFGKTPFITTNVTRILTPNLELHTNIEWKTGSLGAGVNWHGLSANITTNSLQMSKANYLSADIKASFSF